MNRRQFLIASGGASVTALAAPSSPVTVLYGDRSVALTQSRVENADLWVRSKDLPRINEFEVKPQGACRADICIPIPKTLKRSDWFNLSGFAHKVGEAVVSDSGVYSFGELPLLRRGFLNSRTAPDFAVPDRTGRVIHLSDFRGKKVLVVTWASW